MLGTTSDTVGDDLFAAEADARHPGRCRDGQFIEYETDRPEEMWALDNARTAEMGDPQPGFRLTVTARGDRHPLGYGSLPVGEVS